MSANDVVIAHGEKALVLIIVAACGYWLYATFNNEEISQRDISMQRINEMVGMVERVRGETLPPRLKPAPKYLDDMLERWSASLPSQKYMSWLSAATDVGPPDVRGGQLYIYELHPPSMTVSDNIGTIDLTITLPTAKRTGDPRISDESAKTWTLESHTDNSAQWLGLMIEQRIGSGEWQPVTNKDIKNGMFSFKGQFENVNISLPTTEAWQRYSFRSRIIAAVTGRPMDKLSGKDVEQSVLVHQGTYEENDIDWSNLTKALANNDAAVVSKFQKESVQGPFANQLKNGESLYGSAYSEDSSVTATSNIRFVFEKINVNFQNPAAPGASFLLTKFLRDPKVGEDRKAGKWLLKPEQFKLNVGEGLGAPDRKVSKIFGDKKGEFISEDLSTTFVLTDIKQKVKRVLYYEIKPKSRPMGGNKKDLEVIPKEIETELAILTNTLNGTELKLPACEKATKPNRPLSFFYPDFVGAGFNEVEDFKKDPARFKQRDLVPPAPKAHNPGEGPLEELRKLRNDSLLRTDTIYYELDDGRIIYFEDVNDKVKVIIRDGSEAAEAAKMAEEKPAAEPDAADPAKPAVEAGAKKDGPSK